MGRADFVLPPTASHPAMEFPSPQDVMGKSLSYKWSQRWSEDPPPGMTVNVGNGFVEMYLGNGVWQTVNRRSVGYSAAALRPTLTGCRGAKGQGRRAGVSGARRGFRSVDDDRPAGRRRDRPVRAETREPTYVVPVREGHRTRLELALLDPQVARDFGMVVANPNAGTLAYLLL